NTKRELERLRPISITVSDLFFLSIPPHPRSTLFPYTTLFRSITFPPAQAECDRIAKILHRVAQNPELRRVSIFQDDFQSPVLVRSEEHTSELQSPYDLVCRLLLEKKKCMHTCE